MSRTKEVKVDKGRVDFCCRVDRIFIPRPLCCWSDDPNCLIQYQQNYYSYQSDRYVFCETHFKPKKSGNMTVNDEVIHESEFERRCNDVTSPEPVVLCASCRQSFHRICVNQFDEIVPSIRFLCEGCLKEQKLEAPRLNNSRELKRTQLSDFIENRLETYLRSKKILKESGTIRIRVVVNEKKMLKVKAGMKRTYDMPSEFPYSHKVLFAFQDCGDREVAFFSFMVQEYGADCPAPNRGQVYLAYLDSVQYFQPNEARSEAYKEILLGYFEYVKQEGFDTIHLWACPPRNTACDYIFYAHPDSQLVPSAEMLHKWYKNILKSGKEQMIILSYKNLAENSVADKITSVADLPYFEGDHWPTFLEKVIEKNADIDNNDDTSKQNKRLPRIDAKSNTAKYLKNTRIDFITNTTLREMQNFKDTFFVAKLREKSQQMRIYEEKCPLITCQILNDRDSFVHDSKESFMEFSTLRRAKFSTLGLVIKFLLAQKERILCDECETIRTPTYMICEEWKGFSGCRKCAEDTEEEPQTSQTHQHLLRLDQDANKSISSEGLDKGESQCVSFFSSPVC